jgi:predicted ATP-dependent protease
VRLAGRRNKISTMFSNIADLVREAHYFAAESESSVVTSRHIEKAIDEKINRVNLIEAKIKDLIDDGLILIDSSGERVGQVNGLAVYVLGDYTFGKPSKITAQVSLGRHGIINIEREADLGGKTHNKGVLILNGYLRGRYGKNRPLTMSASVCFEQSYGEVDGDSASSTELYAIISALTGISLRQDIAVTGSINQHGEIQAIGGANEKIEGFYEICKARGLTGTQGVIIPESNADDLMLRKDLIENVKAGKFHIYPVKHVDDGINILTGIEAGSRREDGTFPEGTINYLVEKKLDELATKIKKFSESEEKREKDKKKT